MHQFQLHIKVYQQFIENISTCKKFPFLCQTFLEFNYTLCILVLMRLLESLRSLCSNKMTINKNKNKNANSENMAGDT